MGNGFVIAFADDAKNPNNIVAYWNGRSNTADASNAALQQAETYVDGELSEEELMTLLGNVQIAHPDKYAQLKRVNVTVTLATAA